MTIKMMPGQKPYTEAELKKLYKLIADAAEADVTEVEEVEKFRCYSNKKETI